MLNVILILGANDWVIVKYLWSDDCALDGL